MLEPSTCQGALMTSSTSRLIVATDRHRVDVAGGIEALAQRGGHPRPQAVALPAA